ncbi:MAG: ABC transporter substrate-binding protein [Burkholderia sp.]|nr:ABC transporter substrate-binding protein [Burkholderia sp.]
MKKLFSICIFTPLFLLADLAYADINNQLNPQSLIAAATQKIIKEIRTKSTKPGDLTQIISIVDRNMIQYADFPRTTRLAMGSYWHEATPHQRQVIVNMFKGLLIRTYTSAILQLKVDQQIKYLPFRFKDDDTDAVVRTVINDKIPIQLNYRLYKTSQGWRVYDLNVLGIWLIQTYKQQFKEEIQKSGIDGLIRLLSKRCKELANNSRQIS